MKYFKGGIILFLILCISLKLYFIFGFTTHLHLNPDNERNYTIAQNYLAGKGYGLESGTVPHFRLSAYHTSSTVFLFQFLIKRQVSKDTIVLVFYIISTLLYLLAIWYLHLLLRELQVKPVLVYLSTAIFALYPSVMYAIGTTCDFDNLIVPLHVIYFYYLLQLVKGKVLKPGVLILLALGITLSCFLRSQVIPLYFLAGCYMLVLYYKRNTCFRQKYTIPVFWALVALCLTTAFVPVLIKNKKMFNSYIISTQFGFEFLEGHNAYTRGNWQYTFPGTPLENYVHRRFPDIDSLDEYTDGKLRASLAWEWIRAHPALEVKYALKKVVRYFIPENQQPENIKALFRYHPLTILVHVVFLFSVGWTLFRDRSLLFSKEMLLLMIPVISTIMLTVIFYFDFRLRYHAEPFLIIISACLVNNFLSKRKSGVIRRSFQ